MQELIIAFAISTFFTILFLLISESFGFIGLRFTTFILNKFNFKEKFQYNKDLSILNVFVGLLFYGMSLFFIGLLNLLYPVLILIFSVLVFVSSFILYKRYQNLWSNLKENIQDNKWLYLGILGCFVILANSIYRPAVQFDAVWYHLPIPKYFLQNHNIDYNGFHWRYSVHPYLNFFWSLPALSLGLSTLKASLIINITQGFLVLLSVFKIGCFIKKEFKPFFLIQILSPILIGINFDTVFWLGAGYNDLYAFALILILFTYVTNLKQINLLNFLIALYLVITIALLKIFFAFFGVFILFYLCYLYIFANSNENLSKEIIFKKSKHLIIIGIINFVIFILPWLVRSYFWTGRILDPVGAPGMNEDAYNFAGSKDALNHWTGFVLDRFDKNVPRIFLTTFSPLFALGLISIFHSKIREKYMDWWVLSFSGFWFVFFVSIVQENRYYIPQVYILGTLGLIFLVCIYKETKSVFSKIFIWLPIFILVGLVVLKAYGTDGFFKKTYLYDIITTSFQTIRLESTLNRNLKNSLQYYQDNQNYIPKNISKKDKVMIYGIHSSGYIENPIFEYRTNPDAFLKLKNFDDLHSFLIQKDVKFIMVKNGGLENICKQIEITESECLNQDKIIKDIFDPENQVQWYKVSQN
jgi:hypothetical protein